MAQLFVALAVLLAAPPVASEPQFLAMTAEGTTSSGVVTKIGAGWEVVWKTGPPVVAGQLICLRRAGVALPDLPTQPMVILANGDRIAGRVTGGDSRALQLMPTIGTPAGAVWTVPLSTVRAVWFTSPTETILDSGKEDVLLLRSGDTRRGTIERLTTDPATVVLKGSDGVPLAKLGAIVFDPTLARIRKPKTSYAKLVLANGTRITLSAAQADAAMISGTSAFGASVQIPLNEVIALDIHGGKATYLSDLKPKQEDIEQFGDLKWLSVADRNVHGQSLRLNSPFGVQTFDKGLGTHSRTTLVYDLAGKYRRFETVVGLDAYSGKRGAVDITISVDGKEIPIDGLKRMTAQTLPKTLSIDVTKARQLTLLVDFGPGGDVQDDVNWCDARLIE